MTYLRLDLAVSLGGHVWSYCAQTCCLKWPVVVHPRLPALILQPVRKTSKYSVMVNIPLDMRQNQNI
jgi:hypothetical protein